MINLRRMFENHFDSKTLSDNKLRKFSLDHLERLRSNNKENKYDAMINETDTVYTSYFGAITSEDTNLSQQQALTLSKNQALNNFVEGVRQKEGFVRGTWGKNSPEYQEFFPRGTGEYSRATLANVETLMSRMVTAATKYKDTLGQPFLDYFTQLQSDFVQIRGAQLQKLGTVSDSKQITRENRRALTEQLSKNLLTLAIDFIGEPQRLNDFFDQSILRRGGRTFSTATEPSSAES